jgi:pimeloyl-ACP methyl ester carboxylesterase
MRKLIVIAATVLAAACGRPTPLELARTTTFELAREHGRHVEIDGLQLFAITLGTGRDVLLLHGNPASTYSWRKVIEPLAEHFRVHAIDLPGYGFSDKPSDATYEVGWHARFVAGYLDAADIERAVLVGNSMGGHVASEVAILFRSRVSALVLIGASGLQSGPPADRELPMAFRIANWPVVGPLVRALPSRPIVANGLRDAVFDASTITEADVDAYYAPLRTKNGLVAFLRRTSLPIDEDRGDIVALIGAPTLVITGDSDRLVPPAIARRYHELIDGSRLVVLERTGHLPQEERPERVVQEIVEFLGAGG